MTALEQARELLNKTTDKSKREEIMRNIEGLEKLEAKAEKKEKKSTKK